MSLEFAMAYMSGSGNVFELAVVRGTALFFAFFFLLFVSFFCFFLTFEPFFLLIVK